MSEPAFRPPWSKLLFHPGVLREPERADRRLVVWVPAERDSTGQYWQRVSSVSDAAIAECEGLCSIAATAIRARQRSGGLIRKFLDRFRRDDERTWRLPTGQEVEQEGHRRKDLLLVWPKDGNQDLDETGIRARWPEAQVQSLGPRLVLLAGVEPSIQQSTSESPLAEEFSIQDAEKRLAAARQQGDRVEEISALVDVGLWALDRSQLPEADPHLQAALTLARELGDEGLQAEVLVNLGLRALLGAQADQAVQYLKEASYLSYAASDPVTEKLALGRLAAVEVLQGDTSAAAGSLRRAIELARKLGDRQHEAELLWHQAILQSEAGQAAEATGSAHSAVKLLRALGRPQAQVYADHLAKYERGQQAPGEPSSPPSEQPPEAGDLRMAMSAARAQPDAKATKTVPADTLRERLQQCRQCSHYRGLRCRVDGRFAGIKARLPDEDCPLGYWPSGDLGRLLSMEQTASQQVLADPNEEQQTQTYTF